MSFDRASFNSTSYCPSNVTWSAPAVFPIIDLFALLQILPQFSISLSVTVLTACFLVVVLVIAAFIKKCKNRHRRTQSYPQVTWLPIRHVPLLLNGWLTMRRLRVEGMRLFTTCSLQHGSTFLLPFGPLNVLATADPAIIKHLLSSNNPAHLHKSGYLYKRLFVEEMHDGLFVSPARIWQPHRKCLSQGFTYQTLTSYLPLINRCSKNLTLDIFHYSERTGMPLENGNVFGEYLSTRLLHFTAELLTGPGSYGDLEISQIQESIATHKDCLLYVFQHPHLFLRPLWRRHPRKRITEGATQLMLTAMSTMMADFERSKDQGHPNKEQTGGYKPLMHLMSEQGWSKKEMLDNFATFIFAEHEAMFVGVQFVLLHLSQNVECQVQCRQEVDSLFTTKGGTVSAASAPGEITVTDLCQLKYLERCILESLRLCPPVPVFARRLGAPITLDKGEVVKKGQTVVIMPWVLHRNPDLYPHPEKFDPDRFLPEKVRLRPHYAYLPFSAGRRNCLGWKLSLMQLKVTLAWILRHFEISTTDRLEDFILHYAVRVIPERHFNIKFVKRLDISWNRVTGIGGTGENPTLQCIKIPPTPYPTNVK